MIVRFGEGAEVVREQVVRGRDAEERESRSLAQQAAAPGPFSAASTAHWRSASTPDAVKLITQFVPWRDK